MAHAHARLVCIRQSRLEELVPLWKAGAALFGCGAKEHCAQAALKMMVNTGYTPEQADDRRTKAFSSHPEQKLQDQTDLSQLPNSDGE